MNFAAITAGTGFVGILLATMLQGSPAISADVSAHVIAVDPTVTGSIAADPAGDTGSVRLIDLKSGTSCKTASPPSSESLAAAPVGPDCANSPSLSRIAYWRATPDGSLVMADRGGNKVLEFAPGDGVMYESVYPANELITIVPAKG